MRPGIDRLSGYSYEDAGHAQSHQYLLPAVYRLLREIVGPADRTVFELGCGNGSTAAFFKKVGFDVVGVDPSPEGIRHAKQAYPHIRLELGSCYENLAERYGRFPIVVSLEVIEHVFLPRAFAKCVFDLLTAGGTAVISTPFHGYWKNLAMALSGTLDRHFTALWDYGHIKFWSELTLRRLLEEQGFTNIRFLRVGRIPALAKSMIAVATRPQTGASRRDR